MRRELAAALVAVGLCVAGASARAQDRPLVSNVFFQSDLRQALEDVAAQAGVNIIADPTVQGVVSVTLDEVTVDQALDILLAGTNYQVEITRDYFLVYSPDATSPAVTEISETRIYDLRSLSPESARDLLPEPLQRFVRFEPGSTRLAITAPREIMDRIVRDLDVVDSETGNTVFIALQFVQAERARELLPQGFQRFVRTDPQRNTLAVTAPEEAMRAIVALVQRIDQPIAPNSVDTPLPAPLEIAKLSHTRASTVANLLPASVQEYVKADEATNTIAVSAPAPIARSILRDIHAIDVPRQHVMLDARIVVLEQNDILDFGGTVQWPDVSAGGVLADNVDFPWEVRIGYTPDREFTNALTLTLNLLSQNDDATIVASPKVLAQDGIPSEIKVTTEEYFQIVAEDGAFIRSDLEQIETGTILQITPQVGRNGTLTLDMNLEVSDVISRGERNLPVVSRRTARSTIQIANGGTAAVAGLVDARTSIGQSGTPGLGTFPLLGRAFRTDTLRHNARQVAIFVTATIVDRNGESFASGRTGARPGRVVDEKIFRVELEQALATLGVLQ